MMFRGQFEHAIDAKGRTSVPSRFRDVLVAGKGVFSTHPLASELTIGRDRACDRPPIGIPCRR